MDQKTIYALSTVYGKSGVAVVRVSGQQALKAVELMTDLDIGRIKPRYAYFTDIKSAVDGCKLDKSLLLYFKGPHSFNGEDIVEFQIHGSRAVISGVLDSLAAIPGFRLAEPGEFSRRAFYNHKMDLTEAEGLADLIDAETSEQQKYAVRQMDGELKNLYSRWRSDLVKVLAHLEAFIDFPDEDIPVSVMGEMKNTVFKVENDVTRHLQDDKIGERLREGFRVVIVGPPNAGKSSLLNAVAKREAAIVSDIAGTTRDAVDVHLDLKGYPVMFTDTAGLREVEDAIEKKGIEIAYHKINEADLVICLFDASRDTVHIFDNLKKTISGKMLLVANKTDRLSAERISSLRQEGCLTIAAKPRQGLEQLLQAITERIENRFTSNSNLLITRARYREALKETVEALETFTLRKEIELAAEDVRLAARALGKITGRIEVDDILDKIFGSFCIGK